MPNENKGFASMTEEQRSEIARKGGQASHGGGRSKTSIKTSSASEAKESPSKGSNSSSKEEIPHKHIQQSSTKGSHKDEGKS
ncbi:MAG: KGG domain-containing protein [Candidatus Caenarcaniphilales bacterium]|nr:KGG domain-containing protein [Candidatus Caenarcaniphilales bacterium]